MTPTRAARMALVGLALLSGAAGARAADPGDELSRLREENATLRARVRELEAAQAEAARRCPPAVAAAVEQAATQKLTVTPRDDGKTTTVSTGATRFERVSGAPGKHWLTVRATQRDDGGFAAGTLAIDADASGGVYRDVHAVRLEVDGTPLELPVTGYSSQPVTVSLATGTRVVGTRESVGIALPEAALARLGEAHGVTVTLGGTVLRCTPDQLVAIRALAQRVGVAR